MRSSILCLVMALAFTLSAQDDYVQYETMYIKPDYKHLSTLTKNMKAHNDKYHSKAPYIANVWQIANGPDMGYWIWMMGPSTFGHLDARPADAGHDEDWANNVMPYITDMKNGEYWRRDDDLSNVVGDPTPNVYVRFFKVREGKGHLIDGLLEKVSNTIKALDGENPWSVYDNMFRQGDIGRHIAAVSGFTNWAELDEDNGFKAKFIELHGASAWDDFLDTGAEAWEDSFDEIWTRMPSMSATVQE